MGVEAARRLRHEQSGVQIQGMPAGHLQEGLAGQPKQNIVDLSIGKSLRNGRPLDVDGVVSLQCIQVQGKHETVCEATCKENQGLKYATKRLL